MKQKILWRLSFIGFTLIIATVFFLPNTPLFKFMPKWWQNTMPSKGIVLGLDLQGGLHLVYEVEGDKAVESSTERFSFLIKETLSKKKFQAEVKRNGLNIEISPSTNEISKILKETYPIMESSSEGEKLLLKIPSEEVKRIKDNALDQALETIRNRIDKFGVAEPTIHKQGENEIVVQLPGVSISEEHNATKEIARDLATKLRDNNVDAKVDVKGLSINITGPLDQIVLSKIEKLIKENYPDLAYAEGYKGLVYRLSDMKLEDVRNNASKRARDIIGKTAQLEFKIVDDEAPIAAQLPHSIAPGDEEKVLAEFADRIPADDEILFERKVNKETGIASKFPILLKKQVMLTGAFLSEARVNLDSQFNEPNVSISFNSEGAKRFGEITTANVNKRLAIILDNTIYSAPNINEPITGGNAQITGSFSMDEAKDLSIVLKAGALPAPLKMLYNVTVGPSLGTDSIEAGKLAAIIGTIAVVIFMVFYYRLSGVIANFALLLNIVLLFGAMAALNATLTLPGIAGVILAIGMAVDSNVLMFERMRDELRAGKTPRSAVDSGYHKAFWTIFDSHVTTLITALVLFQFGTGPIKGFAVTLSLGVAINLYTALIGTKTVFDLIHLKREVKQLSI